MKLRHTPAHCHAVSSNPAPRTHECRWLRRFQRKLAPFALLLLFVVWECGGMIGIARGLDSTASAFEKGNALFKEGKFDEAEKAYEVALTQGDTASIRFNLARTREALGDPAGAMLEWERALRIDPGHGASIQALDDARRATGAVVPPKRWWSGLRSAKTIGLELWVFAGGVWLCVCAWWLGALKRRPRLAALTATCGFCIATLGAAWKYDAMLEADTALVRERSVTIRGAPADPARSLGELPAGSRVRILNESAGWVQCSIPEIGKGWLPSKSVERISTTLATSH
jgi:tetratricopeptide (TPR) repeat protein